mmetsp:Transcript_8422/g.18465  ORF Transcript_8422/g.18465 Transcript_8422/m.18465 type:complete len:288 (-) Transcript_8422:338-1201(-)
MEYPAVLSDVFQKLDGLLCQRSIIVAFHIGGQQQKVSIDAVLYFPGVGVYILPETERSVDEEGENECSEGSLIAPYFAYQGKVSYQGEVLVRQYDTIGRPKVVMVVRPRSVLHPHVYGQAKEHISQDGPKTDLDDGSRPLSPEPFRLRFVLRNDVSPLVQASRARHLVDRPVDLSHPFEILALVDLHDGPERRGRDAKQRRRFRFTEDGRPPRLVVQDAQFPEQGPGSDRSVGLGDVLAVHPDLARPVGDHVDVVVRAGISLGHDRLAASGAERFERVDQRRERFLR